MLPRVYDTVSYRTPLGVFAGIIPFNFPAMIPMGWMTPICIACGNTIVLKAATFTPQTCMRIAELYKEAGVPDGVVNIVTCSRNEAEIFLNHPDIAGISFVGSTSVGKHIYSTAAANGKRVQALCEAKEAVRWSWRTAGLNVRRQVSLTLPSAAQENVVWRFRWS